MALWKMSNPKTFFAAFAAFVLFTLPFSAFAAYGQLKVPPGWSPPKNIGTAATFKTGPAANQNTYKGSTVLTNGALEIAGQVVQIPVSMRIAANASVFAATYAFGNPLVFGALSVASAAYLYYQQQGLTVENGQWVKQNPACTVAPCYQYKYTSNGGAGGSYTSADFATSPEAAVSATIATMPTYDGKFSYRFGGCNGADTYSCYHILKTRTYINEGSPNQTTEYADSNVGGTLAKRSVEPSPPTKSPIGDVEFHTIMDPIPVPKAVPKELPEFDWPVEQPAINPSPVDIPDTFPSPAAPPASKPIWVPTGDPVKNPTTTNPDGTPKPDTWTQPGKDVKPSGTPSDPWRVDVTDAPKTKTDPSPNTDTPIPTTTTPTPSEIQTCGLPGKPKCAIDETGTPTFDPKKVELDKATLEPAASAQRDKVSAPGDKNSIFQGFSQFFSLPPLAACTPVVMPSIAGQQIASMDVCPGAEWLRGLMGFVWAVAGFLFVFRTVQDVI